MTDNERDDDGGLGEQLRRLLEALDDLADDETAHASASGDAFGLDVDVDVEVGTLDDSDGKSRDRSRRTRRPRRRRSRRSERSETDSNYLVSLRDHGDAATVTVDLGYESAPPPTPVVNDDELRLHRTGDLVQTVQLPFEGGTVAGTSTNNGVLAVDVRRRTGAEPDADTDASGSGDGS